MKHYRVYTARLIVSPERLDKIVAITGGLTISSGYGYWKDPDTDKTICEPTDIHDIGIPDGHAHTVFEIFRGALIENGEKAAYVVGPTGRAALLTAQGGASIVAAVGG